MTTTADPLSGPFPTAREITDYSRDPGYAIRVSGVPSGADAVAWTLARLGYSTRNDEKAA